MGDEDLPLCGVTDLILRGDIDHPVEMLLILVVDEELLPMAKDRIAYVLFAGEEELRLSVFTRGGEVVLFARRATARRDEDELPCLGLAHTTREAHILLLIDERPLRFGESLGEDPCRAQGLIDEAVVDRLAILGPSQRRDPVEGEGAVSPRREVT